MAPGVTGEWFLGAFCMNAEHQLEPTSIDLSQFIGNSNGTLEWNGNSFQKSCDHIGEFTVAALKATCKPRSGFPNTTCIDLDTCIANHFGHLIYVCKGRHPGGGASCM
jgi:hypothetical protein